jgi:hypothetical protein
MASRDGDPGGASWSRLLCASTQCANNTLPAGPRTCTGWPMSMSGSGPAFIMSTWPSASPPRSASQAPNRRCVPGQTDRSRDSIGPDR